ncbi:MAG: PRD domain-containing protein [Erysipelotrichia bacterium]|nr:PRD domain-containing protein [Erysipelotrichia bacterium]
MLIKRQQAILSDLVNFSNAYITADTLSKKHNISLRTLKSDISEIKHEIENNGARIISTPSKGYLFKIENKKLFDNFEKNCLNDNNVYDQSQRIKYIQRALISSKNINPIKLCDDLYISRSTLSVDLKKVKKIFKSYNIEVISSTTNGLLLKANEKDIRQCIVKENLFAITVNENRLLGPDQNDNEVLSKIKNVLLQSFINSRINVSDHVFQNLVVHIYTSVWRMKKNNYIEKDAVSLDKSYQHIQIVAQEIMRNICRIFNVDYSEFEANLLAINIQGKRELYDDDYISLDIANFITDVLIKLKDKYNIDFVDDIDLRMDLALHTTPLLSRARFDLQLSNEITYSIKQNHVIAFDLAYTFAHEFMLKYGIKLTEDEISYLAIHFANGLQRKNSTSSSINVLLISSEKKSNCFLVKQKFYQWFNKIKSFDIVTPIAIGQLDMTKYGALFTTDKEISEKYNIVYVDLFLNESNYQKIEFALNGFNGIDSITAKFYKDLFYVKDFQSKSEIIEFMCRNAINLFDIKQPLYQSVLEHEEISMSYFGHSIAVLHPVKSITDNTFISVLILNNPVKWDEKNEVKLVLLVSIEKFNQTALSFWYYLSFIISNQELVEDICQNPTYEYFINKIAILYKHILRK